MSDTDNWIVMMMIIMTKPPELFNNEILISLPSCTAFFLAIMSPVPLKPSIKNMRN